MTDVFICDGIRTPVGRYGGGLAAVRTDDLAAIPMAALMERESGQFLIEQTHQPCHAHWITAHEDFAVCGDVDC